MPNYHDLKSSENDEALSERLVSYLAKEEGFRARPYRDLNGKQWNIGYGSKVDTSTPGWRKRVISKDEAKALLKADFLRHREFARQSLEKAGYLRPSGRLLDGYGLLFFNTNWGDIAESKRFKDAARTAARGNEDPLIEYAKQIDNVEGREHPVIKARRSAEYEYMRGGQLPVRGEKKELSWKKPEATPTPEPKRETETLAPSGVAQSKEAQSVWDRLKRYAADATDFAFGTKVGQAAREQEAFDKFRTKTSLPKPTPSTPIAAAEKDEPAVTEAMVSGEDGIPAENLEALQRASANIVRDIVLDPAILETVKQAADSRGTSFEDEMIAKITEAQRSAPISSQLEPSPAFEKAWGALAPQRQAVGDAMGRTRALLRRKLAEKQRPDTSRPAETMQ